MGWKEGFPEKDASLGQAGGRRCQWGVYVGWGAGTGLPPFAATPVLLKCQQAGEVGVCMWRVGKLLTHTVLRLSGGPGSQTTILARVVMKLSPAGRGLQQGGRRGAPSLFFPCSSSHIPMSQPTHWPQWGWLQVSSGHLSSVPHTQKTKEKVTGSPLCPRS